MAMFETGVSIPHKARSLRAAIVVVAAVVPCTYLIGCAGDEALTAKLGLLRGDGSRGSASPAPSPSPVRSPGAGTSSSPGASPGSGSSPGAASPGVGGDVEAAGGSRLTVAQVSVSPQDLSLNAPDPGGGMPAGLAVAATLSARVVLSDGSPDTRGVTWEVSDPSLLNLSAAGAIAARVGAGPGTAFVTATSAGDGAITGRSVVTVTRDGFLSLDIRPLVTSTPDPGAILRDFGVDRVTVDRGGETIATAGAPESNLRLRLPAAEGYRVVVTRVPADGATVSATLSNLAILPNTLLAATASLK